MTSVRVLAFKCAGKGRVAVRIMRGALLCAVWLVVLASGAWAGTIRNEDDSEYTVTLHWEDLSPPETFTLAPGGERRFEDKRGTVELVGKKDNMYVWPQELVVIRNGVMRRVEEEAGDGSGD